ncbi:hypothetical protein ANANG_G00176060 [Anguilla anguilla]|uniref:Uncharacterized protein n=1 Tax=Anguilla anguilla TaxID=7936 RepID=A0A9D3RUI5_ANGAN|nr:hypothetical protein ANANG_G00176060 [Anguilla anguilla]
MGKPLSRPDCLRQNPRCLGKGEDEEGYIEDCYVPQRSIYDTMRINEQIDQGSKLSQPSRSTLGSGGGEGSTLSSNGTLGADVGGVFVARPGDGIRKLDERVIFDALKLTGEPQSKLPAAVVGATSAIMPSSSASGGAAAVTKRRHQGGDRKDNPNRRSWKAFMPPTYPEFAERLELSPGDSAEKRLSGAGIPARTWPRSMRGGRRSLSLGGGMLPNLPALPPLPPLLGEDSDLDEESLYLLDPPSPFLQDRDGLGYGGLPLSPCLSQEGGTEGLLGWPAPSGGLRERTASELRFEEDERRILQELEDNEIVEEGSTEQQEREQLEERTWEAVLKLESREKAEEPHPPPGSSGHWPLLTPPSGFGGSEPTSVSPCPSSGLSSDDLFLELERQCLEEEDGEVPPNLQPKTFTDPAVCPEPSHVPTSLKDEGMEVLVDLKPAEPLDSAQHPDLDSTKPSLDHLDQDQSQACLEQSDLEQTQTCSEEPGSGQTLPLLGQPTPDDTEPCIEPIPETEEGRTQEEEEDAEEEDQSSHTAEMEGIGGLVSEWARESDSSGIHMSNPDPAGPSDTGSDCERPETDSDLGSGVSSDGDSREEEKVGEKHQDDQKVPSPLSPPTPENPYSNGQEEDCVDPSWENRAHGVHLCSGLEDTSAESVLETEESNPTLEELASEDLSETMGEITSDLHGIPQIAGASDSDTFTGMAPAPEGDVGDISFPEQRVTSTPKADSPHSPIDTSPPDANSTPPSSSPLPPSKQEAQGSGLVSRDTDAFVATDSFVYLAVSAPTLFPQDCPPSPMEESAPPSPLPKPEPEEGAFLSSDSFVYLAAPERLPVARETCSTCGDSDSEGSRSGVDFVLGSTTGDSEWDSDGSGLETARPAGDQWELLEPGFLQGLFEEVPAEPEILGAGTPEHTGVVSVQEGAEQGAVSEPCPDNQNEAEGLEREQVDCIQPKLQQVNAVGQGLIQSAAKHTDTQALEHDLETTNLRWNSLNKRVAERIAQLQEALLHCGKFQDALEPLLSWLSDTEELIANQKPPSAEYRVVKAQIQEQKLLQRLLDDRRGTVQMIRGRASASPPPLSRRTETRSAGSWRAWGRDGLSCWIKPAQGRASWRSCRSWLSSSTRPWSLWGSG